MQIKTPSCSLYLSELFHQRPCQRNSDALGVLWIKFKSSSNFCVQCQCMNDRNWASRFARNARVLFEWCPHRQPLQAQSAEDLSTTTDGRSCFDARGERRQSIASFNAKQLGRRPIQISKVQVVFGTCRSSRLVLKPTGDDSCVTDR